MSDEVQHAAERGPGHRPVEIGVALFTAVLGLIAIAGSLRVGINWDASGPKAGFFPFYVGLFIVIGSAVNLYQAATAVDGPTLFASWDQLRKVTSVVIPTGIYVFAVSWIGIYVASMLLIAVFMRWLGRYGWPLVIIISVAVPLVFFIVFERYFLIPLPKGPVEDLLGF